MKRRTSVLTAGAAVLSAGAAAAVFGLGAPGAAATSPPPGVGDKLTVSQSDGSPYAPLPQPLPVVGFSFGEQGPPPGTQSTGAGGGKVTFQNLSVTLDDTPAEQGALLGALASGQMFKLQLHATDGSRHPGRTFDYTFASADMKTLDVAQQTGDIVKTTLTFEYAGLQIGSTTPSS